MFLVRNPKNQKNMKKNLTLLALTMFVASIFTACEPDAGKNPQIGFKTGANYVSADAILEKDTTINIGIDAAKSENKDVLKSYTLSRSINGMSDSTIFSIALTGADQDKYSKDVSMKIGSFSGSKSGDKETYKATVINRDGLIGQVSLTVTIK